MNPSEENGNLVADAGDVANPVSVSGNIFRYSIPGCVQTLLYPCPIPDWYPRERHELYQGFRMDVVLRDHESPSKDNEVDAFLDFVGPKSSRLLQQVGLPPLTREYVDRSNTCCFMAIKRHTEDFPIAQLMVDVYRVTQADGTASRPMPFIHKIIVDERHKNDGCYWSNILVYTLLRDFVALHVEVHAAVEADDTELGGWYENMFFVCAGERNGVRDYVYRAHPNVYRARD